MTLFDFLKLTRVPIEIAAKKISATVKRALVLLVIIKADIEKITKVCNSVNLSAALITTNTAVAPNT
ncbi:hypothetical protein NBRC116583_15240 [Arenicella sp. 4NH20-0111]